MEGNTVPKFMETILSREAEKKGMSGKDKDRYTYGGMNNMGFMRGNKETDRGAAAQRKHDMDTRGGPVDESGQDDQPDTGRMGDSDSGQRHGFMSKGTAPKKKRGFMRDAEMEGHG
jgi:hypothetical protein